MRDDILKIYKFPHWWISESPPWKTVNIEFVAIYEKEAASVWEYSCKPTIETVLDFTGKPASIDEHKGMGLHKKAQLIQECLDNKWEKYCVWSRADMENKMNNSLTFWLVWRTGGDNLEYRHMSRISAEEEATRLARVYPGTEFHVLKAESKYCARGVERVEFHDDLEDLPF